MRQVLASSSALLLGMLLLMIGNGLQGSVLGVRGGLEGFSTFSLSVVMSGYFLGFLGGSQITPHLIRRVGHVRVFAALGSFISAALIIFPTLTDPFVWTILRIILGFCFSGVYVTAESWLNNSTTNDMRGKTLSAYMIVQTIGMVIAQGILSVGDPSGYILFIVPSVLVSISFAPILLSVSPTPPFETSKPMTLRRLFDVSPLGCVGMFLMGGVFGAQLGMGSVYAIQAGFSLPQVSTFLASIFIGALVFQLPIGWISDRLDRRLVILGAAGVGGVACLAGSVMGTQLYIAIGVAILAGGMASPLYSLLIAHTNDYLDPDDMAGSSGGLIFINGVGAVGGPMIAGWLMSTVGPSGYWLLQAILMLSIAGYAAWRMTRRAAIPVEETAAYVAVMPSTTPVASEVAQEWAIEQAEDEAEEAENQAAAL
ncbi:MULTISPECIES: MFS transporter [Pacificibacter]|uniref:MFS transporter n=1 Tax=Pacificibacter TaxID=1042323 RepID=UPI001C090BB1|nr:MULTISPECIES: MFS transporter [Pacificibacter]MBU2935257.1 MFS transporter [Pacificibacter marinus]MDO6615411.1 MFS transporter [Pacificibacter sp. 1_MG-2023]